MRSGSTKPSTHNVTDYAGRMKKRRFTRGGIIPVGKHVIKAWRTAQVVVPLSCGAVACGGMVRAASDLLWVQAIASHMVCLAYNLPLHSHMRSEGTCITARIGQDEAHRSESVVVARQGR